MSIQKIVFKNGQSTGNTTPPKYDTKHVGGPPHAPEFIAKVLVEGKEYGEGKGRNKKEAEKAAAEDALAKLKQTGML